MEQLFTAICFQDEWNFNQFLVPGLDIDQYNNEGTNLLNMAASFGSLNMIRKLIEYGADKKIPNKSGHLPIHSLLIRWRSMCDDDYTEAFNLLL